MKVRKKIDTRRKRRRFRVRNHVRRAAKGRPRLSVFRSNRHMYAQIIDDETGTTLASASSLDGDVAGAGQYAGGKEHATKVGALIAERAKSNGVTQVVLDRGGYKYHGRVAALCEAAREGGLEF